MRAHSFMKNAPSADWLVRSADAASKGARAARFAQCVFALHIRYGAKGLIVWSNFKNHRAKWCAPEQASMPMVRGGDLATASMSRSHRIDGRTRAARPPSGTPCRANTCFARSSLT